MPTIQITRNSAEDAPRWATATLPVKQRFFWAGPLFVRINWKGDNR